MRSCLLEPLRRRAKYTQPQGQFSRQHLGVPSDGRAPSRFTKCNWVGQSHAAPGRYRDTA